MKRSVLATWLVFAGMGCGSEGEPSGASAGSPSTVAGAAGGAGTAGGVLAGMTASAGASGAAGAAGASGNAGSAGVAGGMTAGTGTAGSAGSTAGSGAGSGGAGSGGSAGSAGSAGSMAGSGGGAGSMAGSGGSGAGTCPFAGEGRTAKFSFFVTSQKGLEKLSKSPNGFGGDLRYGEKDGLAGADKICRELAEAAYPGAGCKTWRAFLSVTKGADGNPVHAGDRIGSGPWYDRRGRLVAMNKQNLLQPWPVGADPTIMLDLPNEFGVPNHDPDGTGQIDNHNTVTGTNAEGKLFSTDWASTCHDWTSKVGTDGKPVIGFTWKGGAANRPGARWYSSDITEGGCADIINTTNSMDFSIRGIGALGGYGGFYCLALEP